jgi:hypothetical protein
VGIGIAFGVFTAPALAAGSVINMRTPGDATAGSEYSIRLTGHVSGKEKLYLFVSPSTETGGPLPCKRTPASENKLASGTFWSLRRGSFTRSSKWTSAAPGAVSACAYLVKEGEPQVPSRGVLAHRFGSFTVGCGERCSLLGAQGPGGIALTD